MFMRRPRATVCLRDVRGFRGARRSVAVRATVGRGGAAAAQTALSDCPHSAEALPLLLLDIDRNCDARDDSSTCGRRFRAGSAFLSSLCSAVSGWVYGLFSPHGRAATT